MKRFNGLLLALVVAASTGCARPVHNVYTKQMTLVAMEPISISPESLDKPVRLREVDGSCQYWGRLGSDGKNVRFVDVDVQYCYPGGREPGSHPIDAVIFLGTPEADIAQNAQVNVAFSQL
jgi:hypothetical protein